MHATCAACLITLYLKYRNPEPYYAVLLSSEDRLTLTYTLTQTRSSFFLTLSRFKTIFLLYQVQYRLPSFFKATIT